jgi:hypothetical protein
MKIRQVGAKLFHADGQTYGRTDVRTDMKLIAAFRNFAKVPKKVTPYKYRVKDFLK